MRLSVLGPVRDLHAVKAPPTGGEVVEVARRGTDRKVLIRLDDGRQVLITLDWWQAHRLAEKLSEAP